MGQDFEPITEQQLEASRFVRRGARIVAADAVKVGTPGGDAGFQLSVVLSDGSSLLIVPDSVETPDLQVEEVADWEVFTPYDRYLRVGPGLRWSYLASRENSDL